MRGRWFVILLGVLLWLRPAAAAEEAVQVQARLNRVQITVGDHLTYELMVVAPPDITVELPPQPTESFGEWEVRGCETLPETPIEGKIQRGWRCTLTIWETGYHALPTQIVKFTSPSQPNGRINTQPLSVEVATVLDENPSDIKPIKPQLTMDEQVNYLLIVGLSLLSLLLAGFLVWAVLYYRRHRPQPVFVEPVPPPVDPVAEALAELERIAKLNLVPDGKIVEHYSLIADVLRNFIANRFSIPALERTTSEVRRAMNMPQLMQRRDILLGLLAESDGVKFARRLPNEQEATMILDHARQAILAAR